jgi:ferredoxin-like protein FixX
MTIDPQHTLLANELEEIRWARTEAHVHLCMDTSSHGERERRAIVFCPARCDTSVDRRYLILQKPAEQVDMMGREIEKRAAPGPS